MSSLYKPIRALLPIVSKKERDAFGSLTIWRENTHGKGLRPGDSRRRETPRTNPTRPGINFVTVSLIQDYSDCEKRVQRCGSTIRLHRRADGPRDGLVVGRVAQRNGDHAAGNWHGNRTTRGKASEPKTGTGIGR